MDWQTTCYILIAALVILFPIGVFIGCNIGYFSAKEKFIKKIKALKKELNWKRWHRPILESDWYRPIPNGSPWHKPHDNFDGRGTWYKPCGSLDNEEPWQKYDNR